MADREEEKKGSKAIKPEPNPEEAKRAGPDRAKASSRSEHRDAAPHEPGRGKNFHVLSLMQICRLDTPLVKRVPNSARSLFFQTWGKLLHTAMFAEKERQYPAWCEWAMFHKAVLWTPPRGGARLAKKASYAAIVNARIDRWDSDREKLWDETVRRSRARETPKPVNPKDVEARNKRVEKAALAALAVGDVRKALQQLNSAPIAPACEETYRKLVELNPVGDNPEPIDKSAGNHSTPRFQIDVVCSALSTFGPGSAGGLLGYKPFLLQQGMRAERESFGKALTDMVNMLASGRAPAFLQPILAGGVSIALHPCASYAHNHKHKKYDKDFKGQ